MQIFLIHTLDPHTPLPSFPRRRESSKFESIAKRYKTYGIYKTSLDSRLH
jgi:hypothetical protein